MKYAYFTCLDKNLKIIKTKEIRHNNTLLAYNSRVFSLLKFVSNNLNIIHFTRDYDDGSLIITERFNDALQTYFNFSVSIYYLDIKNFDKSSVSWTKAIYSDFDEKVIKEEYIINVYEELLKLEKTGEIIVYRYPKKYKEVPQDDSDLIYHAIRHYYQGASDALDKLIVFHPKLEKSLARELAYKKRNNPKYHHHKDTWTQEYHYLNKEGVFCYKHFKDPNPWHVGIEYIMSEYAERGLFYEYSAGNISNIDLDKDLPHCHSFAGVLNAVYDYPETFFIPDNCRYQYSEQELEFLESVKRTALLNGLKDISKFHEYTTINKDGMVNRIDDLEYNLEELKKRNYRNVIKYWINKKD